MSSLSPCKGFGVFLEADFRAAQERPGKAGEGGRAGGSLERARSWCARDSKSLHRASGPPQHARKRTEALGGSTVPFPAEKPSRNPLTGDLPSGAPRGLTGSSVVAAPRTPNVKGKPKLSNQNKYSSGLNN